MKRELSIYLDILRIAAALTVFASHLARHQITDGVLWHIQPLGHNAVIVFFVLSGFVIQHVASSRETDLRTYAVSRLSRLNSVVLPAIALTIACDTIGMSRDPSLYAQANEGDTFTRILASALFISQSWSWNLELFSNGPFWSLPYEFWYYAIFGAFTFLDGRPRIIVTAAAALAAGPSILLMLPIWLAGVVACRTATSIQLAPTQARTLFAGSAILVAVCLVLEVSGLVARSTSPLMPNNFSPMDYVLGVAVAFNIVAAANLKLPTLRDVATLRWAANMTFPLYLFHVPLLLVFATFVPAEWPVLWRAATLSIAVLLAVVPLGIAAVGLQPVMRKALLGLVRPATSQDKT